jgi:DNA polymerase-3 subunit epsilon
MPRQIVLDTETTGLDYKIGHRIIEIGCVELINRRLTGNNLHYYINPERKVEHEALAVHGIDNEFLRDKPRFAEIAQQFCDFIDGAEVIAHNAAFDVDFINHELKLTKLGFSKINKCCKIFDTLVLARKLHPGQRNSLDALAKRYHIENFNRDLHGALLDAEILAQVYLVMTGGQTTLFGEEIQQSDLLMRTAKPTKKMPLRKYNLCIIKANNAELQEHYKFKDILANALNTE